jgi:dihydrofolate reductase
MRKIVLTEWVSLDGYSAGPNNDMGFVGESFNEEMGKYEDDFLSSGDTLLLGRVTYDSFSGAWPHVPDNPNASEGEKSYARKLNAMRKIVFSRTLASADWNNSSVMRDIDVDAIRKLKEEDGKNILVYGSASIVRQLTELGLIDEYEILVHPVVLGGGTALFGNVAEKCRLKLLSSTPFTSGVVLLKYARA